MSEPVAFTYEQAKVALEELSDHKRWREPPGPSYIVPPYAETIIRRRLNAGELLSERMILRACLGKDTDYDE